MWIPPHVGIISNSIADNIAAKGQEEAPEGMVTGLISKQIKSRPNIYSRKVQEHMELADSPIYQEARERKKKSSEICTSHRREGTGVKVEWQGGC
eukprot:2633598-Pleurochrysis_carterae.AAC.1